MAKPLNNPFFHITQQLKDIQRHGENSARLAHAFGQVVTTGWGEFVFEDTIKFDAPYLHKPSVSYGCSLFMQDAAAGLVTGRFPRAGGFVSDWDIDTKGFYRGAWVAVTVETRSPFIQTDDPSLEYEYILAHDFTFLGVAMKDLLGNLNGDVSER